MALALTQDCVRKCFPRFTCPGTQRSLHLWAKRAQLLLELMVNLGVIHMMLGFVNMQNTELQSYRIMEASTQISKEGLGGWAMCSRVRFPARNP
jgi:hypothetical protein